MAKIYKQKQIDNLETTLYYNNDTFLCDLAGCTKIDVSEDSEIRGNCIYPGGGDWVVYDDRGETGTYGCSHDGGDYCKVRLKNPEEYKVDYTIKSKKLVVNPMKLMDRYRKWVSTMYDDSSAYMNPSIYSYFKDKKDVDGSYKKEKKYFENDHYLALYWLIHFGFTLDDRYYEVEKIVKKYNLYKQNIDIENTLDYFSAIDPFYNSKLPKTEKDLFIRRRAYLIYSTYSYHHRGSEDDLEKWWLSIKIYPYIDDSYIYRLRWLKNNLTKFNKYNEFMKLTKEEKIDIPLVDYIYACNPSNKDKQESANEFLKNLIDVKDIVNNSFAQVMLWDIREDITQFDLLNDALVYFFQSDVDCKEYADIVQIISKNSILNPVIINIKESRLMTESFWNIEYKTKDDYIQYFKNMNIFLTKLSDNELYELIDTSTFVPVTPFLVHLILNERKRCKPYLVKLLLSCNDEKLMSVLFKEYKLDEKLKDYFLDALLESLSTKDNYFKKDDESSGMYNSRNSKKLSAYFLSEVIHTQKVFEFAIEKMQSLDSQDMGLKEIISEYFFSPYYHPYADLDDDTDPTYNFSKEDIEQVFDTIVVVLQKDGYYDGILNPIMYCVTSKAKDWLEKYYDNVPWLKQFDGKKAVYDGHYVWSELNKALDRGLESLGEIQDYIDKETKEIT